MQRLVRERACQRIVPTDRRAANSVPCPASVASDCISMAVIDAPELAHLISAEHPQRYVLLVAC